MAGPCVRWVDGWGCLKCGVGEELAVVVENWHWVLVVCCDVRTRVSDWLPGVFCPLWWGACLEFVSSSILKTKTKTRKTGREKHSVYCDIYTRGNMWLVLHSLMLCPWWSVVMAHHLACSMGCIVSVWEHTALMMRCWGSTRERKARTNHQKGKNSQIPLHKTHTNFLTDITLKYLHDNRTTLTAQKSHKDICTQSYKNRSVAQKCLLKIAQVFHKETHKSRTRKPSHKISHNHSHKNRTKTGTKKSHHHSHKKIVQKYLHNSRTKNILTKISYRPECQMSTQISHKTVCTTLAHRRGSLK